MKFRSPEVMPSSIDDILNEKDDLGLLSDVLPRKVKKASSNDPVITNFLELQEFVKLNGREPSMSIDSEKYLAVRLRSYRSRSELQVKVHEYDEFCLLSGDTSTTTNTGTKPAPTETEASSLDDILNEDDDLGLLEDIDTSIYKIEHISETTLTSRTKPDEIAQRKACSDFYKYQRFFEQIHEILRTDAVMLHDRIVEADITIGQIFILNGMLCYVDSRIKEGSTTDGRDNPRIRVIFENATETNILKHSLLKALWDDKLSRRIDLQNNLFSDNCVAISRKDKPTGFIYILATESKTPELALLKGSNSLVKIGYTTQDVSKRVKNAETDPTYLCAPVKVLSIIDCFNLNPQKFENLIHAFLNKQRLNVTMRDSTGRTYQPEEWFTVTPKTAMEVCRRIIDGSIVRYRMDNTTGKIVKKITKVTN